MRHASCAAAILIAASLVRVGFGQATVAYAASERQSKPSAIAAVKGHWIALSAETGERKATGSVENPVTMLITDDKLGMKAGGKTVLEATYALDPLKDPKRIDLWATHDLTLGIYQLEGNRLTLCLSRTPPARPTRFTSDPSEGGGSLITLCRALPLWIMNADGSNRRRFIVESEYSAAGSPDWSSDGKHIAFDAWRSYLDEPMDKCHVLIVGAEGGVAKDLGPGAMPSWSPDGKRIAMCQYPPYYGVWIMNANGSGRELIDGQGWGIRWSPSSDEVAYHCRDGIRIHNVTSGKQRTLHTSVPPAFFGLAWSRDGKQICYRCDQGLAVVDVGEEGAGEGKAVVLELAEPPYWLTWRGKDRPILISAKMKDDKFQRLYQLDPTGKQPPKPLEGEGIKEGMASSMWGMAWSPDGKQMVFVQW